MNWRTKAQKDRLAKSLAFLDGADLSSPQETAERKKPEPSLRLDFYVNDIGYQCDVFTDGREVGSTCRDFGGGYNESQTSDNVNDLYKALVETVKRWAKKL